MYQKQKPTNELSVTKNYSLSMLHIAKVSDLAQRLGISQGEVVRRAIDAYWDDQTPDDESRINPI